MPTLEENVNRVKAAKTAIGNAITAKGGTVGANDGLEDFASDIASIPSGGDGNNAKFVSNGEVFHYECLESVVIPQGITAIGNQSFPNTMLFSYLKTIEIPASVTSINEYAFSTGRMPNLEKIIINKPQDSISGSPWHAGQATIIWTG
jgi:hypothetical protein